MFTALAIITMFKYKVNIYYTCAKQKIPTRVKLGIWAYTVLTVVFCILLPSLTVDRNISDRGCYAMNIIVLTSLLVTLSAASLYLAHILCKYF